MRWMRPCLMLLYVIASDSTCPEQFWSSIALLFLFAFIYFLNENSQQLIIRKDEMELCANFCTELYVAVDVST